MIQPKMKL